MEAQVSLTVPFSSSAFFGLLFLIFLLTIPHRFSMGFRSGEFAGQSSTPTPWSFNQLLMLLAVWAGAKSCWKKKSASFKIWSAEGSMKCSKNFLVNGCSEVGFQKNTMDQHQQMTLHPKSSQTVETEHRTSSNLGYELLHPSSRLQDLGFQMKYKNLLSSEKRTLDHWPTVRLFFSLAQVRRL